MKTKSLLLRLMISAVFTTIPVFLHSQVFNEQPDPSVPLTRFSETSYAHRQNVRTNDPLITAMVAAVSADTLRKTLQQLQDWGSRCLLNDNHKDVATWLKNKFISYGYTDVKLDSFYLITNFLYIDTSWQYNVVCTLNGSSAPDEVYVIGGHYDSFSFVDPYNDAPGVDDNGTSVAATLEIARVMANINYQPQATIRFTLFAAEELGLFGSRYAAGKARLEGEDVRYMFDLDMVAYNPDNLEEVKVYKYLNFEWACYVAATAIERYTGLSVIIPEDNMNSGSDSYSYRLEGFPSIYYMEAIFNPYIHKAADTLGNCNVPYFAKVTGGALATLAEQLMLPYPQNLTVQSTKDEIILSWKSTNNAIVRGFNIYRSDSTGGLYQKISPAPVSDSNYHDLTTEPNKQYYYVLTTVNDSVQESGFSEEVSGARFNFSDTLLVIANLKGTQTTPYSVYEFYRTVLDTIPFVWQDVNASQKVNIGLLSRYRNVLWMSNTPDFEPLDNMSLHSVSNFIANGGNLLFAGFLPMQLYLNTDTYPVKIPETTLFRQLFKVDSVDRKIQSMLFRANAVASGYDTLNADTLKYMQTGLPGQIYNVEVFTPMPEANVIYRFDTKYDSTTNSGKMKHRPVGLEYMGTDFKSILISFPLWYMDTGDVRKFLHYVMKEKFTHPVGIEPMPQVESLALHIYPNPVTNVGNVNFTLAKSGQVKLSFMSMKGQLISTWIDRNLGQGNHWLRFQIDQHAPGLYQVVLQCNEGIAVRKIVMLR